MLSRVLDLLVIPSADIFIVLLMFSFILNTTRTAQYLMENLYSKQKAVSQGLQLIQRYIAYYLIIVLGNIANRFVTTRLPLEAVPYLIEITSLLRLIKAIINDSVVRFTIDTFIDLLSTKTQIKVPEPKDHETDSVSQNDKRGDK